MSFRILKEWQWCHDWRYPSSLHKQATNKCQGFHDCLFIFCSSCPVNGVNYVIQRHLTLRRRVTTILHLPLVFCKVAMHLKSLCHASESCLQLPWLWVPLGWNNVAIQGRSMVQATKLAQATSNTITLKGSTKVVTEFFAYAVNT